MIEEIKNSEEFENEIKSNAIVFADFYAEWCMPCKMLGKVLEEVEKDLEVVKVNVDEHQDLAAKFKVMGVPTLVLYDNNEIVKKVSGYMDKEELLNWYNN